MTNALVIVESPAKIKTLRKFLDKNFTIESSVGHIRDLPSSGFGIDMENGAFEPHYELLPEKKEVVAKLIQAAKKADVVYLSPDPDREGEAIAWHIASILPKNIPFKRVTFNAITKDAVLHALDNPRDIDESLVNAQQARRLLDRIVGYKISPILARKIQRGRGGSVSAGRVQSVALKLVVDREKDIEAFKPVEYWNIDAQFKGHREERSFGAFLFSIAEKRVEKEAQEGKDLALISNETDAKSLCERLKKSSFEIAKVDRKEKRRNPVPPFITSTLQQEASRHFRFSASRTMAAAQGLYEGIDMGKEGAEGLITYMRTDSVRIAPEALTAVRSYIEATYGKAFLPSEPKLYATSKAAQDAHEAIRPTNLAHPPELVKDYVNKDQFLLYGLIWKRFIASQMLPAVYDTVSVDVQSSADMILRATGSQLKFQGFLAVYEERQDEESQDPHDRILPELRVGDKATLLDLTSEQSFTKPPPRFTEASLVKELEKSGIGRPSTYASIMDKIQGREYTIKESTSLRPTELGRVIAQMLETNFSTIMDISFTAKMEDELERISQGDIEWKKLLEQFWHDFIPTVEKAEKEAFVPKILTTLPCPQCQKPLQKVWSRSKYFYGCSGYPECEYTAPLEGLTFNKEDYSANFHWEQPCPKCQKTMKVRHGRFGAFLGCEDYPECKGVVNIPKKGEEQLFDTKTHPCVAIGCTGSLKARRSRFGKIFYSCSEYPDCNVIVNDLDQLSQKYKDHPKTAYVKKTRGKKGKTHMPPAKKETTPKKKAAPKKTSVKKTAVKKISNMPKSKLSSELASIVGAPEMTRTEITKRLWDYIKAHKLQDAKDKRKIVPDAKLSKVLGTTPVSMFSIPKLISAHIKK